MLCRLLLISIVLNTYAFLSCGHSMFHLFIRYFYHIFIAYISYSSTYHLIYYLSNGSSYISYSMHVIFLYIYYFHGYILYTICYVLFSCTVFMYCDHVLSSYTVSTYCIIIITFQIILHSYTFSYITSDRIISCYKTYHHVLISYSVFMLYFSYYFLFHACKYQRNRYRKLIRARRRCTK